MHAFPPLQNDARGDVAVLGGGITGALITDELVQHGFDAAVIDERDVGWGSTARKRWAELPCLGVGHFPTTQAARLRQPLLSPLSINRGSVFCDGVD